MKPFPAELWYDSVHDCSIFSILPNEITMIFHCMGFYRFGLPVQGSKIAVVGLIVA